MLALAILDWAVRAVSIFTMIALLWLGLTVLLNAEQRRWGTWLAGGGLVLGGLFFAAHLAVIDLDPADVTAEIAVWWRVSWLPFVGAPYLWYVLIAWYCGVLGTPRHRLGVALMSVGGLAALGLLVLANPVPGYETLPRSAPGGLVAAGVAPAALLLYPLYSLIGVGLSLVALYRPASSGRFMGDLARRRALPWLVATAITLLVVSLIVGSAAAWLVYGLAPPLAEPTGSVQLEALLLAGVDLTIVGLVALAVVLLGRAIVSYEIFTGKTLPRGGLSRHWRASLALAAGYGILVGGSLLLPIASIYHLLLATILMTLVFALLSWRSYLDRERSIDRLRPFVASERLYDALLRPAAGPGIDAVAPFRALCDEVLGARWASLIALGPLAPLVGPPLVYPPEEAPQPVAVPPVTELAAGLTSPRTMCVPLEPAHHGRAGWAVPLWSERGLSGVLLLGPKRDGGIYTQEEIELARATGERLIDTRASAEMARRLMTLQRQRLAESQLLDRQARRVLHDEVLPQIHTAMLTLSAAGGAPDGPSAEVVAQLADIHRQIAGLLRAMPAALAPDVARLGLVGALRQVVASELANAFDQVNWPVEPEAEAATRALPPLPAEVLYGAAREAIRNAARYGRNGDADRPLRLTVAVRLPPAPAGGRDGLEIVVEDDGVGLGAAGDRGAGAGQGLALHGTMMAIIGGTLTTESVPGASTRVVLTLPAGMLAPAGSDPANVLARK